MRNFTVAALMRHVELNYPNAVASETADGRSFTGRQVQSRSNRLANVLAAKGLGKGARVAYVGRNRAEFVDVDFALAKGGFTKVPVYFRLSSAEISHILEVSEVRAVIADSVEAQRLNDAQVLPADVVGICLSDGVPVPGWLDYEQTLALAADSAPPVQIDGSDLYQIRFTSGSTGRPKGCLTTHAAGREAILGNLALFRQEGPTWAPRNLVLKPVVMAAGWTLLPTLLAGGTNVFAQVYDPERVVSDVVDKAITWLSLVPTMLRDLSYVSDLDRLRASPLECLTYGGEPAPLDAIGRLTEVTDSLVQTFGQTEAPSYSASLTRADHRRPELWTTIGRALPNVTWAVLDDLHQVVESPGVVGDLALQSASITAGLLGGEAEYAERLVADSWWLTGDVGSIDPRGYITLLDRKKQMIISGGSNIYPGEIERALEEHPHVREAAVFGVSHDRWGERPVAVVYAPDLDSAHEEALKGFVSQRIAKFKVPDQIEIRTEPLPRRGAEGKLHKQQIAEQFHAGVLS